MKVMRATFGGNSGYVGYSMSVRAQQAKAEGRYPKTQFKSVYGLSERKFQELLDRDIISGSEWHHTSMYGNRTKFYGINNSILFHALTGKKDIAFAAYKATRNYAAPVVKNDSYRSNARKVAFLTEAADFAADNMLSIGDVFAFRGQQLRVVSTTKRRHYPVCKFIINR